MKKTTLLLIYFLFAAVSVFAKEGMWLPTLLGKYNIEEMQQMGFKLTAQDIYDVNNASMKDAVVIFGGGCTGELISDQGLLITNYHCGYSRIQSHSSLENDILTNGFWAMDKEEELANPGLTVRFLEYMKDVTNDVLQNAEGLPENEKQELVRNNIAKIESEASDSNKYFTQVKPLFYGNQYFLYVYKTYTDVRLVGAPPSAIGKFGGDTDNWMWPRHTGDFSVFRIYADKNNEPADYSPDNVPFKPKKFFPISMKGVQPGDFTMVFGNPGSTQQYIPHQEVEIIMGRRDPDRIKIRDEKLQIIGSAMEKDPKVRIQYSAKYQRISNAWKKWQGEIKGLKRLGAVNKKLGFENQFQKWAEVNGEWETTYKPVFDNFDNLYAEYKDVIKASDYYSEIVMRGQELFKLATIANSIVNNLENNQSERAESIRQSMLKSLAPFYKDFSQPVDEKLFAELIPLLKKDLDDKYLPLDFRELLNQYDKQKLLEKIYKKSILADRGKLEKLLQDGNEKQLLKLRKDPLVSMAKSLSFYYNVNISPAADSLKGEIDRNMKTYMAGIMEMQKGQALYPDANLTLRVTYGKAEGYGPGDGVIYKYFTTLSGIMEKDNPDIYDYDVPDKLKELYNNKDFGKYEDDGDVPVCFTASNHTSGGNSGSPVINGNGELIGLNFDRCWEGTMSDIVFDPAMCRNISLDVRYALFIIDKFAGAGYLLDEMEIVY